MADGSIIIDTRIDTGGVSKGMNAVKAGMTRISAQVSKMGDSAKSSFQRQITAITDLYQNYEKQERKVSELKSKLEELSKVRIETEEYKKLKDDMKALENEFEKVETKQREWLEMGFSIDSAPLKELDKQMDVAVRSAKKKTWADKTVTIHSTDAIPTVTPEPTETPSENPGEDSSNKPASYQRGRQRIQNVRHLRGNNDQQGR